MLTDSDCVALIDLMLPASADFEDRGWSNVSADSDVVVKLETNAFGLVNEESCGPD